MNSTVHGRSGSSARHRSRWAGAGGQMRRTGDRPAPPHRSGPLALGRPAAPARPGPQPSPWDAPPPGTGSQPPPPPWEAPPFPSPPPGAAPPPGAGPPSWPPPSAAPPPWATGPTCPPRPPGPPLSSPRGSGTRSALTVVGLTVAGVVVLFGLVVALAVVMIGTTPDEDAGRFVPVGSSLPDRPPPDRPPTTTSTEAGGEDRPEVPVGPATPAPLDPGAPDHGGPGPGRGARRRPGRLLPLGRRGRRGDGPGPARRDLALRHPPGALLGQRGAVLDVALRLPGPGLRRPRSGPGPDRLGRRPRLPGRARHGPRRPRRRAGPPRPRPEGAAGRAGVDPLGEPPPSGVPGWTAVLFAVAGHTYVVGIEDGPGGPCPVESAARVAEAVVARVT